MKSAAALTRDLCEAAGEAAELENQGADIASILEIGHDPMMLLALAATGTSNIGLMTCIVL